jgi:glycosyltransferase involved in cell wall biosynthesis
MGRERKLLIVCPYPPGTAPSQRFRIEPYLPYFREAGFEIKTSPFLDEKAWQYLYKPGHTLRKIAGVLAGFFRRVGTLVKAMGSDYVLLHREGSPVGPPVFEWLLFVLKRKVVFDFDDAIFVNPASRGNPILAWLRWPSKTSYIAKHSYAVAACNQYLVDWSLKLNPKVSLIPTIVDPRRHRPLPKQHSGTTIVGWTGSHSTMGYLEIVRPALVRLQRAFDFEFRVICDVDPGFPELQRYKFVRWKLDSEIEDLNEFDIGLMPVPDGDWERGKVGFKAIQYSAMSIVPVASNVGSGPEVVEDGVTGLLPDNTEESWANALEKLLGNPSLIPEMGERARTRILQRYSVDAVAPKLIAMFE